MKYLLGVDIGTTSLKAAVFDENGVLQNSVTKDYTLNVNGDFVEFPAEKYVELVVEAYTELSRDTQIAALAVDTQCETMILTDKNGVPLCDAVVWLDNRAAAEAECIKAHFGNEKVYTVTGQPEITATWPASKLLWFKKNRPEIFEKTEKIFLLEDYILYRLTGEFVTEKTLQSSSLYFDIRNGCWWEEMLEFVGISKTMLPRLTDSATAIGTYHGATVVTGAIDQIAGAIGAGVTETGTISEMTGTTMAIFAPCDEIPPFDPESIVPCHLNYDGKYCRLAWTSTAGIALKWFKNNFCEEYGFKELDALAETVPAGSCGLTFLPYLCGSTMPKYDPLAKGAFVGFTMEHTRAHAVRAILESVACMLKANLDYLGVECEEIRAMGGGAMSPLWCHIKADLTRKKISVLKNKETACLGAAVLAGVGAGIFPNVKETCERIVKIEKTYQPSATDYTDCYKNYCIAEGKIL